MAVFHILLKKVSKYQRPLTISIIFSVLLPFSLSIKYIQNDEWIYYLMTQAFMKGDFVLHPYVSATFYIQGLLAMIFAYLFGVSRLPVLTLIVSVLCFWFFWILLDKFILKNLYSSFLIALFLLLNPLFVYSTWGFMTENYFLLLHVLSLFFLYIYLENRTTKNLLLVNLFIYLSYFVRQLSIITSLALTVFLFFEVIRKRISVKQFVTQFGLFSFLMIFHYFIFPKTSVMYEDYFVWHNITNFNSTYAYIFAFLIFIATFLFPMVLSVFVNDTVYVYARKVWLLPTLIILISISYFYFTSIFQANLTPKGEFPYFGNIFEQKGFYATHTLGNKYHFYGIFVLYKYWDVAAKLGAVMMLFLLVKSVLKKELRFEYIYIFIFFGVMVVSPVFYDRYLLPVFPIFIIAFAHLLKRFTTITYLVCVPFLLFLLVINYQFSADFVIGKNYVWTKATELVRKNVPASTITVDNSWNRLYNPSRQMANYVFRFDNFDVRQDDRGAWEIVDQKEIKYPLNFFIKPTIYLYHRIHEEKPI